MVYKILLVAFCFCVAFVKIWFDVYLVSMFIDHIIDVISSNPKYNADYLNNIIRTKWLKILEEMEG